MREDQKEQEGERGVTKIERKKFQKDGKCVVLVEGMPQRNATAFSQIQQQRLQSD